MAASDHSPIWTVHASPVKPALQLWWLDGLLSVISTKFELPVYGSPNGKLPNPPAVATMLMGGWGCTTTWLQPGMEHCVVTAAICGTLGTCTAHFGVTVGGPTGKTAQEFGPVIGVAVVGKLDATG